MEHKRNHWSNWHITVNTNQHEQNRAQRIATAQKLADAVDDCCTNPKILYTWLLHYVDGRKERFTKKNARWVSRVRARVGLEVGPNDKNRSVHCHILLEVEHKTRVQIDQNTLKQQLCALTGFGGINISTRFVKGDGEDKEYLLRYIQKDGIPNRRARDPDNLRIQATEDILEIEHHQ